MLHAAPATLDDKLKDAFSIISLLIAIVAGYLAAVWPTIASILVAPTPPVQDVRKVLAARCRAYEVAAWVLAVSGGAVAGLMAPLILDVLGSFSLSGDYSAVRAAALLFAVFMLATVGCAVGLAWRLRRFSRQLRST